MERFYHQFSNCIESDVVENFFFKWVGICSVKLFSFGAGRSWNHLAVDGFNVWNFTADHRPVLLFGWSGVDWVADEDDILEVSKLGAFGNFFPVSQLVVGDVESVKFLQGCQVIKSLDEVVREPELLKCGGNILQVLNSLDVVAGKGQNFEVLKALHWHDLDNWIRWKRKFLTILELVDFIIELFEGVGKLTHQIDLSSFLWGDAILLLPSADRFSKWNSRHSYVYRL